MAETYSIDCQKCFATIRIRNPELIGRKVACPKCGEPVRVRAPIEDDDEEAVDELFRIADEPERGTTAITDAATDAGVDAGTEVRHPEDVRNKKDRRKKRRKKGAPRSEQDLSGVRTGIFLLFFQAMVWIVLMVNIAGFLFVPLLGMKISDRGLGAWLVGVGIVFLLSYVIGLIGKVFCLKTPESVGREFITIALGLEAIAFTLGLLTELDVLTWGYARMTSNVIGALGSIVFLWFLSDLALHLDREYLSDDALHIVGLGFGAFVVSLLVLGSTFFLGLFGVILFLIPLIMVILIFVRYITLIVRLNAELKR